jgi:cation diffusion facilitator family transporter
MTELREESRRAARSVTLAGAALNSLLILLKFSAGIMGKSQALIADAVHSVSDLATDAVVLFGLRIGGKSPDEEHPFGHARIETLASAILGLALIVTALYLGVKAAFDIYLHEEYFPTNIALVGAVVSIITKEALYHYTVYIGHRIKNQLVVANAWHHRSDALSSVAVLLGVIGTRINPAWYMLDSFAAGLVSFFIVRVGLRILGNSLREFTDTAPKVDTLDSIRHCARNVEGVLDIHDLRVRTAGGLYQMEIHITVHGHIPVVDGHSIAKEVERCLSEDIEGIDRVIVHVDPGPDSL